METWGFWHTEKFLINFFSLVWQEKYVWKEMNKNFKKILCFLLRRKFITNVTTPFATLTAASFNFVFVIDIKVLEKS